MNDFESVTYHLKKEEVLGIHSDIIEGDDDAEEGVLNEGTIEFVTDYVKHGHVGQPPGTVHEKAAHLMRLLAANHSFLDGNKRTALNSTWVFYVMNGYYFDYGEEIKALIKMFAIMENIVDIEEVIDYFEQICRPLEESDVSQELYEQTKLTQRFQKSAAKIESSLNEGGLMWAIISEEEWEGDSIDEELEEMEGFVESVDEIHSIAERYNLSSDFWDVMSELEEFANVVDELVYLIGRITSESPETEERAREIFDEIEESVEYLDIEDMSFNIEENSNGTKS